MVALLSVRPRSGHKFAGRGNPSFAYTRRMALHLLEWPGAPLAILSAALFGVSTPFAKLLLGDGMSPWLLAGLLYLGSGIGLGIVHLGRQALGLAAEAPLRRAELPWLVLVVLSGGAIGPVLLLIGLATTPAASA